MLERRLAAWAEFENLPMPKNTDETWRRTSLRGIDPVGFTAFGDTAAGAPPPSSLLPEDAFGGRLVQIDWRNQGRVLDKRLAESGVILCSLQTALSDHEDLFREYFLPKAPVTSVAKFERLHTALTSGGMLLYVPDNLEVQLPVHNLVWLTGPGMGSFAHSTIVLGKGARLELVEESSSATAAAPAFSSSMVDIHVGAGARLDYVTLQNWGLHHVGFSSLRAVLGRDATLNFVEFALGAALTKTVVQAIFPEQGSDAEMWGLYLGNGRQHIDHETHQHHIGSHTQSNLMYKGVLRERARSVYHGLITIEETAGQSRSYQANHNLLLSNAARADSIPKMEIKTNDVRCKHGAAVGRLNDDEIFYLRSRGLTREQAEKLIIRGFLEPVIGRIVSERVRATMEETILARAGI